MTPIPVKKIDIGSGTVDEGLGVNGKFVCQTTKSAPSTSPSPSASPWARVAPLDVGKFVCQATKSAPSTAPLLSKSPGWALIDEVKFKKISPDACDVVNWPLANIAFTSEAKLVLPALVSMIFHEWFDCQKASLLSGPEPPNKVKSSSNF